MGLKVLAHVLKAAINAELSANTGAMTHHLEVGVGLEKKHTDGGQGWHLLNGRLLCLTCGPRSTMMHSEL